MIFWRLQRFTIVLSLRHTFEYCVDRSGDSWCLLFAAAQRPDDAGGEHRRQRRSQTQLPRLSRTHLRDRFTRGHPVAGPQHDRRSAVLSQLCAGASLRMAPVYRRLLSTIFVRIESFYVQFETNISDRCIYNLFS